MNIKGLLKIEKSHSQTGQLPSGANIHLKTYLSLMHEWDAKKCEGFILAHSVFPILKARSLYMRGRFDRLNDLLEENLSTTNLTEKTEWQLEQARLFNAEANWTKAIETVFLALENQPTPITLLTLLQVRSLAYYESGDFERALHDLESIESLRTHAPKNISAFYAEAMKIKLLARVRGLEIAKLQFSQILRSHELNADKLLTLFRTWIDLLHLEGRPVAHTALACLCLSEKLGDRLYRNLALVELFYAVAPEQKTELNTELNLAKKEFKRIQIMLDEFEGAVAPISTTVSTALTNRSRENISLHYTWDHILIGPQILYSFSADRSMIVKAGKLITALRVLTERQEISKSAFFESLWGAQKYTPRLHDTLIWNILSRLRKNYLVESIIQNETIILTSRILRIGS